MLKPKGSAMEAQRVEVEIGPSLMVVMIVGGQGGSAMEVQRAEGMEVQFEPISLTWCLRHRCLEPSPQSKPKDLGQGDLGSWGLQIWVYCCFVVFGLVVASLFILHHRFCFSRLLVCFILQFSSLLLASFFREIGVFESEKLKLLQ